MIPTEFDTLLDYQKIMSQLVLKEALAGVQQDLTSNKSRRKLVSFKGEVRRPRRCCWLGTHCGAS